MALPPGDTVEKELRMMNMYTKPELLEVLQSKS